MTVRKYLIGSPDLPYELMYLALLVYIFRLFILYLYIGDPTSKMYYDRLTVLDPLRPCT